MSDRAIHVLEMFLSHFLKILGELNCPSLREVQFIRKVQLIRKVIIFLEVWNINIAWSFKNIKSNQKQQSI